jgi:hypothetical protein
VVASDAVSNPAVPDYDVSLPRRERWAVVRDFVEASEQLTPAECRMLFELGQSEPDRNLGTAIMCGVLCRRTCPADIREMAETSERPAVRRAAVAHDPSSRTPRPTP